MRGGEHTARVRLSVSRTGALGHGRRLADLTRVWRETLQHLHEMGFRQTDQKRSILQGTAHPPENTQTDRRYLAFGLGTPLGVDGWRTDLESETVLLEDASQIQGFLVEIKSRVELTSK